jgi:presenilin-like A22 family membrane protease
MKHKAIITGIILGMFLVTQLIGLFIIGNGAVPEIFRSDIESHSSLSRLLSLGISFIVAITFFLFLIQYKWKIFLKIWFGLVIMLTLTVVIYSIFYMNGLTQEKFFYYSLLISLPITILKIFRLSIIIHNLTEIMVYSGLSLIFVDFLTPITIIFFLILISFYDMWAVWKSGIMQKMAKFQMNEMKIFNGFYIPYLTKEIREKLRKNKEGKKIKVKIPIAILGGGDIAFTLIPAGVFLRNFGLGASLFIVAGGFLGLTYLLFKSEKKKFYPAMPFITLGIFLGILAWLIFKFLV